MASQLERREALRLELLSGLIEDRARAEGKSLRRVARELGISPGTFSRLRDGRAPDAFGIVSILSWLDIPASMLLEADVAPVSANVADRVAVAAKRRRAELRESGVRTSKERTT